MSSDPIADGVFKVAADGTVTLLNNKLFDSATAKAIISLGGNLLKQAYLDAYNKDFSGTARTLVLGATALVPYVGSFVSPIIGLLWPPNVTNNMMAQTQAFVELINGQIQDYDLQALEQQGKTIMDLMSRFDDLLNDKPLSYAYGEAGTIQETLRKKADDINKEFISLLNNCQKRSFKAEELTIYTTMATARLLFLNVIEQNGHGPKMQMDDKTYEEYKRDLQNLPTEFMNYIKETSELGKQKINGKMKDTMNTAKGQALVGSINNDENTNIDNLHKTYLQCLVEARLLQQIGEIWAASKAREKAQKALQCETNYRNLIKQRDTYIKQTVNNEAFKMVATRGAWAHVGGNWYHYDTNGKMKTGWFASYGAWYYLNPKTTDKIAKGQMVKGWFQDDNGVWYYLNPTKTDKFKEGQMAKETTLNIEGPYGNTKSYHFNADGACTNVDAVREGSYKIVSVVDSSKVLDFDYATDNHAKFWSDGNVDNQKWELKYDKDKKAYQIISKKDSSKILAWNAYPADSNTVFVTKNQRKPEHFWILENAGDGYFFIKNNAAAANNKVLGGPNSLPINGTLIQLYEKNDIKVQKFKFAKY